MRYCAQFETFDRKAHDPTWTSRFRDFVRSGVCSTFSQSIPSFVHNYNDARRRECSSAHRLLLAALQHHQLPATSPELTLGEHEQERSGSARRCVSFCFALLPPQSGHPHLLASSASSHHRRGVACFQNLPSQIPFHFPLLLLTVERT